MGGLHGRAGVWGRTDCGLPKTPKGSSHPFGVVFEGRASARHLRSSWSVALHGAFFWVGVVGKAVTQSLGDGYMGRGASGEPKLIPTRQRGRLRFRSPAIPCQESQHALHHKYNWQHVSWPCQLRSIRQHGSTKPTSR